MAIVLHARAGQLIQHLLTYRLGGVFSTPLPIKLLPTVPLSRHLVQNQKGGCAKSGRSGAHKLDKLGLSCKADKCSDTGAGDLGALPTHETSLCRHK